jgi:threonine/homoserine/homoserine lactone efflux protein
MRDAVILSAAGANLGLRRNLAPLPGIAAGFWIQIVAVCGGRVMLLTRWPQLHGALQCLGATGLLYLAWSLLRVRAAGPGSADCVTTFWEVAARQLLNPRAWLMSLAMATLLLPAQLEQALAHCCAATI